MSKEKRIYKVRFVCQDKIYEIYANSVGASSMLGFIEISELVFGEGNTLVLDPAEESLKNEFAQVKRTFIPMHSVIRIDEVAKRGTAKVIESDPDNNVTRVPFPMFNPPGKPNP